LVSKVKVSESPEPRVTTMGSQPERKGHERQSTG